MSLAPGARLGAYEVVEIIGAGGMGEVYRARDTKLQRDVAIKVLSDQVAGDRDRLSRFEREAQVLASLNHPNIGHIYGLEETSGGAALILELIEGPTLADRVAQGPIPIADALPIARQVAEAVEAAHEQGIIHRDLKPANIKVRDDGTVKVLDFGLAKALEPVAASGSAVMNSPTLTARATQLGVILGTAAYMAPEQARGKPVDRRADVWAFGVVFLEMLTGKRAFDGDEVSDVLAAVLKEAPPIDALPADTPAAIRRLLRRCLEKDRRERLADMSAVRLEIKDALAGDSAATEATAPAPQRRRASLAIWAGAAGLVLVAGVVGWLLKPAPAPAERPVSRFSVPLPAASSWTRSSRHAIAISPDGSHVAYVADNKLFLRKIDQFEAVALAGANDPTDIFFSSDSKWVGFFAEGRLQKVAITGGAPLPLCSAPLLLAGAGASWSGDAVVFGQDKGLYRVPAGGGTPELIVTRDGPETLTSPQLLPGGETILYTKGFGGSWNDAEVVIEDVKTHARATLLRGGFDARYVEGGYLVYARANEILAVPVDLAARSVTGTPVSLVSRVPTNTGTVGAAQFSVSATGALVYMSGAALEDVQLVWAGFDGRDTPIVPEKGGYTYPRVSPDGSRIVFIENVGGNADVYVLEWARKSKIRVTRDPGAESAPIWSPDSKRVAYSSPKDGGQTNLFVRSADGTGPEERLTTSAYFQAPFSWSSDGNTLFYVEIRTGTGTGNDIFALPMTGDRTPVPLVTSPSDDRRPAISPDGRWLAYGSNESGPFEILVRPYPDVNKGLYPASAGGGTSPLWSMDGKAIYYRQGTKIMRVNITTTPDFKAGAPFEVRSAPAEQTTMNYSLAPDGKRFAIIKPSAETPPNEYRVVLNWIEEVKARVVPKK